MIVFITGVTGFLGGEIVVALSQRSDIKKIYCLIRANNYDDGLARLQRVFKLHNDPFDANKVIPIIGDLTDSLLTQQLIDNANLKNVNLIIHSAANTSFSKIYDDLIEKINIHGLERVLCWAKTLSQLKSFVYVGTATICGKGISNRVVYETESPSSDSKHFVKYTYTKMLGEIMIHKHLSEEKILIVRPSIIMGDSRPIIPRSNVILWTLATVNFMRLIPMNPDSNLDIIPVDYAAQSIIKIIFSKRNFNIYHISSGVGSATTSKKVIFTLKDEYPDRPEFMFVNRKYINQMKNWAKGRLQPNSELYKYQIYLDYWEKIMQDKSKLRIIFAGLDPYIEFIELGQIFDNTRLINDAGISNPPPAHEYIKNNIPFLNNIDIFEGALDP